MLEIVRNNFSALFIVFLEWWWVRQKIKSKNKKPSLLYVLRNSSMKLALCIKKRLRQYRGQYT